MQCINKFWEGKPIAMSVNVHHSDPTEIRFHWGVPLVVIIAIITRFYHITADSLWIDEGFTVRTAALLFMQMWQRTLADTHQPLHGFLLHFWINLFGSSELAVRSFSALLNILTVMLIIPLGKQLFNQRVTLYTLLIFLFSPFQVYYAQEARSYSLLEFLSILSVLIFLKLQAAKKRYLIALVIVNALLIHTHVYGWLILLLENSWFLYLHRKQKAPLSPSAWLAAQIMTVALFLPYFFRFKDIVLFVQHSFRIKRPGLQHLAGAFLQFSGAPLILALISVIILLALWRVLRAGPLVQHRESIGFLLLWIFILVAVPFLLSLILRPIFMPRYAIAAAVSFYFLIALSITRFPGRIQVLAVGGLLILSLFYLHRYYREATREPWRMVVQDLRMRAKPGDVILLPAEDKPSNMFQTDVQVIGPECSLPDVFLFYANGLPQRLLGITAEQVEAGNFGELLAQLINGEERVIWYVDSHFINETPELLSQLSPYYTVLNTYTYFHRDLYGRQVTHIRLWKLKKERSALSRKRVDGAGIRAFTLHVKAGKKFNLSIDNGFRNAYIHSPSKSDKISRV